MSGMKIDLSFNIVGREIPTKHEYELYSALSGMLGPEFHDSQDLGIFSIRGVAGSGGVMLLTERSKLKLRVPAEQIASIASKLCCKQLCLKGNILRIGALMVRPLLPSPTLRASMVTIRPMSPRRTHIVPTPDYLLQSLRHACEKLNVKCGIHLVERDGQVVRRTIRVKDCPIIGFPVIVDGLSDEDSITLQEHGLGGRRKLGCGLFLPGKK
jgi:CRISPR-associated protein Cas6